MDSISPRQARVLWSFWLACGLAVTGGIAPYLIAASGPNRTAGVALPFGIAAAALAANALTYRRGRPVATLLYFLAGIALVYGMLWIVAVPLRLAVVGTCPPVPAECPAGFEHPFTSGESNALAIAIAMGTLAILVAFFGLWAMYRMRPRPSPAPPVRRETSLAAPAAAVAIEPKAQVEAAPEALQPTPPQTHPASSAPPPDSVTPDLTPPPKPAARPRVRRAPKRRAELPPPIEPLELPPPVEPLELPASTVPEEPPSSAPSST
jgi:hypothetical protein